MCLGIKHDHRIIVSDFCTKRAVLNIYLFCRASHNFGVHVLTALYIRDKCNMVS